MGEEIWRIIRVYARKEELEGILTELEGWAVERDERVMTLMREDFNARTGMRGGLGGQ